MSILEGGLPNWIASGGKVVSGPEPEIEVTLTVMKTCIHSVMFIYIFGSQLLSNRITDQNFIGLMNKHLKHIPKKLRRYVSLAVSNIHSCYYVHFFR